MATPIRIAVVNHDSVFLRLTEQILQSDGHEVILCPSGTTAHQVIAGRKPDVVMVDSWLSQRDEGWLLIQTLRLDEDTRHIPILLSTSDPVDVKERAADLRAMRNILILPKPFDPEALLHAVSRLADPAKNWDAQAQAAIDDPPRSIDGAK